MSVFGWCNDGYHQQCIKEYHPCYIERGKIFYAEELKLCECKCHRKEKK